MIKKNRLNSICIFSLLLMTTFSTVNATTPSYIGVSVGDSYTWPAQAYQEGYKEFLIIMGSSVSEANAQILTLESLGAFDPVTITLVVVSIGSDVGGQCSINISMSITDSLGNAASSSNLFSSLQSSTKTIIGAYAPSGLTLLVATNVDWASFVASMQATAPAGGSVTQNGNGYSMTTTSGAYTASMSMTFDEGGALQYYEMSYNEQLAATVGNSAIPGYEITIILGFTGVSAFGLIYIVMKKKK